MINFDDVAWDHYLYWQRQDKKTLKRINALIKDIQRHPFESIGKPEPLRRDLSGYWSRRIDDKNRLVYRVAPDEIVIIQCRFHYGD
ncbi:MAG: Txe/YoeB family addiction module toxin [Litorimonas sp.]